MMDWILVVLGVLFLATTSAFMLDFIPYPIGWIVLGLLFFLRLTQIRNMRK
jgi:hypothetical protein